MALIDKLEAIGNGFRQSRGTTDKYTLDQMAVLAAEPAGSAAVIESLEITSNGTYTATDCDGYSPITVNVPQDGAPTDEELVHSGQLAYRFAYNGWNWVIEKYGNRITTTNVTSCTSMFNGSNKLKNILFNIDSTNADMSSMFSGCSELTHIPNFDVHHTSTHTMSNLFSGCTSLTSFPYIYNAYPSDISLMFNGCDDLRELPDDYFATWNMSNLQTYAYSQKNKLFHGCYSIRKLPQALVGSDFATSSVYSCLYYNLATNCYALDEIKALGIETANFTSNAFYDTFKNCYRLKELTFKTNEDGTPRVVGWKRQTIDLTTVGSERLAGTSISNVITKPAAYAAGYSKICKYNSGISSDKVIVDDVTYQALKDDPDSFVCSDNATVDGASPYSRYNRISAINTINSLPDTSAAGGTNTIKFKGDAGSATDGGAINTLTEEEIAVAAAKGWTVTLA